MYYSLVGLLALLLLLITNHDVLFKRRGVEVSPAQKVYRHFLFAVMLYYVTDILWGVLDYFSLTALLYIDTEIYFIAMALGILFWTQYVIAYLENMNAFRTFLSYSGIIFFAGVVILTILNTVIPLMFWFDEAGVYHEAIARNITLFIQVLILLLTSVYAFRNSARKGIAGRKRYITIGMFGLVMLIFISIQFFEPYMPLYAIGYMLGCSLLRTFVIGNEREEYQRELETALEREENELNELHKARILAYTDSLTGAGSRLAYAEKEDKVDNAIYDGNVRELAVVVFDLNGLKQINDSLGHDSGDKFIVSACDLIRGHFKNSPVFRIGGDEFVAVLEGQDYENREELIESFNRKIDENRKENGVVISAGIAEYDPEKDANCRRVFERADQQMYARKEELKKPGR